MATCAEQILAIMGAEPDRMHTPAEFNRILHDIPLGTIRKTLYRLVRTGVLVNPLYSGYALAGRDVPLVPPTKSLGTRVVELEARVAALEARLERMAVAMDDHTHTHQGSASPASLDR